MAYRTSLEGLPLEPLITPELASHPQVVFERLRAAHGAVAPVDVLGVPVWLVLGYREALEVLRNEGLWRKDIRHWKAFAEGRIPWTRRWFPCTRWATSPTRTARRTVGCAAHGGPHWKPSRPPQDRRP